jgi:hypothetical protein
VQELSKFVAFEDPPEVVNITSQSDGGAYVPVDLTLDGDFTGVISGVQGMMLRIQMDDSGADANSYVLIKKIEDGVDEPAESMRVFAKNSSDFDDGEGSIILTPGQGLDMGGDFVLGFEYRLFASGASTANLKIFVLGYWDKVTGVGTQDFVFTSIDNDVAANTTVEFNIPAFGNRGNVHEVIITETGGLVSLKYDVKTYKKDTFLAADLTYQVDDIDPGVGPPNWRDTQPWVTVDDDGTAELHISIFNKDLGNIGTYDITIRMEKYA